MKMYFTRFCCFSRMVPYIRILLLVRSERFTSNFRQLKRRVISTPLIMLRSLSLKKDKSKNSTYILVNRVRRCSVRRSLSSLFNLLALFGARIGRAPLIVFAMIDDSHARAHDFLSFFLSLSLSLSLSHARTDYERGISSRTRLDRKHRTCGQSQPRPLSNNRCERCSQGVKNQTSLEAAERTVFSVDRVGMFNEKLWARFPRDDVE